MQPSIALTNQSIGPQARLRMPRDEMVVSRYKAPQALSIIKVPTNPFF